MSTFLPIASLQSPPASWCIIARPVLQIQESWTRSRLENNLCQSVVTKQHLLSSHLSHVQFPMNDMQVHSWVHTEVAKGAPALLVHCQRGYRHAWTHQPRIRLLLLGQSQGPRCSPWLQRATSVCVREDEKWFQCKSAECVQQGPRCTLRTTLCCLSRRGSHAALTKHPWTGAEMCQRADQQRYSTREQQDTQVMIWMEKGQPNVEEDEAHGIYTGGVRWHKQNSKDRLLWYVAELVLSPVQASGLNVCTTCSYLIRATIGQRWSRLGEDGGGQESPHRRQNILHNTPKNHIPWCHYSQTWTSSPRSKHSSSLPHTPSM